ncbi:DMT family transporter [Aestuariibaculum suncheonense]|uniref:EamA family transporter n=1 Tax=Aestuariibaculum suncheonense TaxID=1028745 RepID=A0A8J6Q4B2_9FLAO|nr:DMT family transporter [Aestuariibaculum suncheonense]MBD0834154.1 EamA family transporter [Aestuariibaculum suncheonense]
MKNQHSNHLIQLTLATFFISTSGALGKYIDLPIPIIIWWRCIIAGVALFAFCNYKKFNLKLNSKSDIATVTISALLMGGHWITYFLALKLSNVALGMLSLFTFPILTAFLEPLLIKTKFDPFYILLGILVLFGLYILAPEFNLESSQLKGVLFGLLSAVFYALRNILSKKLTAKYNGSSVMFYQSLVVALVLSPALFFLDSNGLKEQFPYIIFLGLITTAIGHTMLVNSLKHFTVSTASIINSVQPIFGIILAFFFLNEIPNLNTFIGGSLILATVIIESVRSRNR